LLFVILQDHNKYKNDGEFESSSFKDVILGLKKLLCNPQAWLIGVIGCMMWFPIAIYAEAWGVAHLQDALGYTREDASHAIAFIFLGMACGGPFVGLLSDYLRTRRMVIFVGAALTLVISSILIYMPDLTKNTVFILCFFFGFFNSPQVLVFPMAKEISDKHTIGSALAVTNMLVMTAGIIQPITGYLLRYMGPSNVINGVPIYGVPAYHVALAIIPVSLLITLILVLFTKETYKDGTVH